MALGKGLLRLVRARDLDTCAWHGLGCGSETLVPHHRANRGMGGSRSLDRAANIVLVCAVVNGLFESDAGYATLARARGFKLLRSADPTRVPLEHAVRGWVLLDDVGGWVAAPSS